ncbi:TPA: phosphate uptake regulator PhoU [Candidatus Bathyarchaeota archaeon]|nr:phosphate uptake regulator PhoU [Candidatus Bathyarchaeota archaeon]HIJ09031.1 phosphate uptake regulator PhoU [Candidatus Bathyarchaeota archaeon]
MVEKDLGYRRVQCTGRGSYIISLPKEWVEDIGLKRGNEIDFSVQSDSSLALVPRKLKEKRGEDEGTKLKEYFVNVDPKDEKEATFRMVRALYAIGADIIHIHFKSEEEASKYKTETMDFARNTFLGSEVIDETPDEITLQILIRHTEFPIEKAVRRMAVVALSANKDAIEAFKNRSVSLFESVIKAYNDVNRLGLYIVRQLKYGIERNFFRELGFKTPKEFLLYRIAVNEVQNIGEDALNIINNLGAFQKMIDDGTLFVKDPIDEEIHGQLMYFNSMAQQLFEDAIKAMFKREYKDAEKLITRRESFVPLENELIMLMSAKKLDPNVASVLRLIFDSSRRIMDYSRNMAELTLNRTVEEICSTLTFK